MKGVMSEENKKTLTACFLYSFLMIVLRFLQEPQQYIKILFFNIILIYCCGC